MALKKCPACAEEINEAAIVCKHCGKKIPKTSIVTLGCLGLIIFIVGMSIIGAFKSDDSPSPRATPRPAAEPAPAPQPQLQSEKRQTRFAWCESS